MLCVTGLERDSAALARRIRRVDERLAGDAAIFEVRLDSLQRHDDALFELLAQLGSRALVCCRRGADGGRFSEAEPRRLALLERAAASGVGYVDVEADVRDETVQRLRRHGARLILSSHDFGGIPHDLERRAEAMSARPVDVIKLAVRVDDAADLSRLLALGNALARPALLVGMGTAGLLSRCRFGHFGAPWTYVCAVAEQATAPGQLTLAQALELGLPASASQPFIALLGGPAVAHSPGPASYNRLFRQRGLPYSYVPVLTARALDTVALLRDLGAAGASVTAPHKQTVVAVACPRGAAQRAEAINTLCFEADTTVGLNTDCEGIAVPLARALEERGLVGASALILGAGGAARAARLACETLRLRATASARDLARARAAMGSDVPVFGWQQRADVDAPIVINATPLGGARSPWPTGRALRKQIVFDLAIAGEPSALLEQARAEGALALSPQQMWVHQGALQMRHIAGLTVTADELAAHCQLAQLR